MLLNRRVRLGFLALLLFCGWAWLRFSPFPEYEEFRKRPYSLLLTASGGEELKVLPLENGLRRMAVSLETIPKPVRQIFIGSEDRRFYLHPGIDPLPLVRVITSLHAEGGPGRGASTITMQLARIIVPRTGETSLLRDKMREAYNALRLETRLSKKEILSLYLNNLPFGYNIEGLETAARYYYGKQARDLSAEEALILAVIPRNPSLYDPFNPDNDLIPAAQRTIPRLSVPIDEEMLEQKLVEIENAGSHPWPDRAQHFVLYTAEQLTDEQWISGEPIQTSLNLEMQSFLEWILMDEVIRHRENRIGNGAGLAIDYNTGEILAYAGSVDFHDRAAQGQIDGVRILRQPGSTLKPHLYALALEAGFTSSTVLPDIPMSFGREEAYFPQNYNERFNGPVRLSVALGSSLNIPAVYLLERISVDSFADGLINAGFDSVSYQRSYLGLGLALGNAEVSLMELVCGFSIFPRGGTLLPATPFPAEEALWARTVYKRDTSLMIRDMLADPYNRILGLGRDNALNSVPGCFKTGTSNQFNNIWALGAGSDIVCGIWMGNFTGETVIGKPGSSIPAQIVVEMLKRFDSGEPFPPAEGFQETEICALSGLRATRECPEKLTQAFRPQTLLSDCDWHREGQVFYPPEYREWAVMNHQDINLVEVFSAPEIMNPVDGAVFFYDPTLPREHQSISVLIRGSGSSRLYYDGTPRELPQLPTTVYLPVEPGGHELSVDGGNTIYFQVH